MSQQPSDRIPRSRHFGIAGQRRDLPAGIVDIAGVRQHARAGTVRLVVAFTAQRFPEFPDVPTSGERGYQGLEVFNPMKNP